MIIVNIFIFLHFFINLIYSYVIIIFMSIKHLNCRKLLTISCKRSWKNRIFSIKYVNMFLWKSLFTMKLFHYYSIYIINCLWSNHFHPFRHLKMFHYVSLALFGLVAASDIGRYCIFRLMPVYKISLNYYSILFKGTGLYLSLLLGALKSSI